MVEGEGVKSGMAVPWSSPAKMAYIYIL